MQAIEIILLVCGALAFVISFFLPDRGENEENTGISREEVRAMVDDEIAASRDRIEDMTEETMNYALEKAERSLDRISNEKMLAFGEYSDNVLDQIGKNQQESVFLHDMLNKNKDELTELLNRADGASKDASLRANEAYDLAGSAKALAQEAYDQAATAGRHATLAESKMIVARKRLDTPYREPEREEESFTADDVIARARTAAALRRASMMQTAAPEETGSVPEEVQEEPAEEGFVGIAFPAAEPVSEDDREFSDPAGAEPYEEPADAEETEETAELQPEDMQEADDMEAVPDEPAEADDEPEDVIPEPPHRMTAMERIAALKTHTEEAPADSEVETPEAAEEDAPAPKKTAAKSRSKAAAADTEPEEKPKAKRTTKKTTATKASAKSSQMSLQDLMPKESVSLQFGAGGGPVNNNQKILEMHKMGRSNMAIAKELGLGLGEVKLVIDLFENS